MKFELNDKHELVLLPPMAYSYLSSYPLQSDVRYQYTAPIIPFLIFACLYGAKNILSWIRWRKIFLGILISLVVCTSSFQIILPLRRNPLTPRASYKEIIRAAWYIPDSASLTAGKSLGAHFTQRQIIKGYSVEEIPSTEFVFLDLGRDFMWGPGRESFNESVREVIRSKSYDIIFFKNGILLLKMGDGKGRIEEVISYLESHREYNQLSGSKIISFIKKLLKIEPH